MGFSTIGLYLRQAFDNSDYREAWTCIYVMLAMVLFFDWWSAAIRRRMNAGAPSPAARRPDAAVEVAEPANDIAVLWRRRPRDRFLRLSLRALALLAAASLITGFFLEIRWAGDVDGFRGFLTADDVRPVFSSGEWELRRANLTRFVTEDIVPAPLLDGAAVTWNQWLGGILDYALPAAWTTLWISILAIVLAAVAAAASLPFAARTIAAPQPWLAAGRPAALVARGFWFVLRQAVKLLHVLTRAVPEVVLAFILLAIFGGNVWPAVLALAIHNFGILGRLGSETVDNASPEIPAALRAAGATRLQVAGLGVMPVILPRLLIFFFYRWETCLRESTALGILGCATLGYYIQNANARFRFDEMLVLVLLGAGLVVIGDFVSALVRLWARRAVQP
jgi:phosphonate transport system permease protein